MWEVTHFVNKQTSGEKFFIFFSQDMRLNFIQAEKGFDSFFPVDESVVLSVRLLVPSPHVSAGAVLRGLCVLHRVHGGRLRDGAAAGVPGRSLPALCLLDQIQRAV